MDQSSVNLATTRCKKENLDVNPTKTVLVPFSRRKRLDELRAPSLDNELIEISQEASRCDVGL